MSLKDLFNKKTTVVVNSNLLNNTGTLFESPEHIDNISKQQKRYISNTDFSDPKNFARFGSAEMYYGDSIKNIYRTYPFDGTITEKTEWELKLTDLEAYIFNYEYPKTVGYITLGTNITSITSITASDGIYSTAVNPQYITIRPSINSYTGSQISDFYSLNKKNNILALNLYGNNGNTIEFWAKFGNQVSPTSSIIDLWNSSSLSQQSYNRYLLEFCSGSSKQFRLSYSSGSHGVIRANVADLTDININSWNHYAISTISSGSKLEIKAYINGNLVKTISTGSNISSYSKGLFGNIGSYVYSPSLAAYSSGVQAGYGILSASIDEFRFWKYARTPLEIGRSWFTNVDGTNNSLEDLALYYKFNEGVVDSSSVSTSDSKILDFSGRLLDATYNNYSINSRVTESAIDLSGLVKDLEKKDPIIRTNNPILITYLENRIASGSLHDADNKKTIYDSLPYWIIEEEEEFNTKHLKQLTQIIGSHFDDLYNKIENVSRLHQITYNSGNVEPYPFYSRNLDAYGFKAPDLFSNSEIVEQLLSRTDDNIFDEKLYKIKNLLLQNIYNNLIYIYKTKGTEKSIRNLLRAYGIDEELVKINLYSDGAEYNLKDTFSDASLKKKTIDFFNNFDSTIYQYYNGESNTLSYIPKIDNNEYNLNYLTPFTFEAEFLFPKRLSITENGFIDAAFVSSSLFGAHTANPSDQNNYTWYGSDLFNFQVYFVKDYNNSKNGYFKLVSNGFGKNIELTSSRFSDVYDNNKWNFAVKFAPQIGDIINLKHNSDIFQNLTASLEFYGVNTVSGRTINEFFLTSSLSGSNYINAIKSDKRIYVGAHKQNFTGSTLAKADSKILSTRVWADNLSLEEIKFHSKDVKNYGRENSLNSYYFGFYKNSTKLDTLLLNWSFDQITSSNSSGEFFVLDSVSGSSNSIPVISNIKNYSFNAKGSNFKQNSNSFITKERIQTTRQKMPETVNSYDMIKIKENSDLAFEQEKDPQKFFLSIENNMYQIISEEMLDMFSGISEFNNLIGEPLNKYEKEYKDLNRLRTIFYKKVGNTPKLEKYLNFYKWLDSSLGLMIEQLIPASSRYKRGLSNVIENTVLQRDKIEHKLPVIKQKNIYPKNVIRGIEELKNTWTTSSAKEGDNRNEIYKVINNFYSGSDYVIKRLSKIITTDGVNQITASSKIEIPVRLLNILNSTSSNESEANFDLKYANYSKNYEVIQTVGRKENNKSFISAGGFVSSSTSFLPEEILSGSLTRDIGKIERTKTKSVFANRFNAPGGKENKLDPESEEYSIYSTINYRNIDGRNVLNITSSQTMSIDENNPSFYKVNKNRAIVYKNSYTDFQFIFTPEDIYLLLQSKDEAVNNKIFTNSADHSVYSRIVTNMSLDISASNTHYLYPSDNNTSFYFPANNNGLQISPINDFTVATDFTIDFSLYYTNTSDPQFIMQLGGDEYSTGLRLGLYIDPAETRIPGKDFIIQFGSTSNNFYYYLNSNILSNEWSKISITKLNNTLRVYVNGVLAEAKLIPPAELSAINSANPPSGPFLIGSGAFDPFGPDLKAYVGYMDNIRFIVGKCIYFGTSFTTSSVYFDGNQKILDNVQNFNLSNKYDNLNIARQIPRNDSQYRWITSSAVLSPTITSFISDFPNITTYNTSSFAIFSGSTAKSVIRLNR